MVRAKLGVLDYVQRGVAYTCVGLCLYAVTMSVLIHRDTMRRGQGLMDERVKQGLPIPTTRKEEPSQEIEQTLAEQAVAIFKKRAT
ncbi:hypothetical protein CPB83DRAFT_649611 [Crepidotus variabilis]|uniref:Uncharacterized protein n=1 Tax=Crepidotus variabilis TaxID=179855 RepID=A0A9P6JKF9_9AGAR|nr:hypothetical protein CPB83DRAFT_649611 [Crepidotus variabilis]